MTPIVENFTKKYNVKLTGSGAAGKIGDGSDLAKAFSDALKKA